jgi:hypothetical protein
MVSAAQLFGQLADAAAEFESRYRRLVDQLAARRLPLVGSVGAIRTSKGESPVIHTAPNIRSQSL